MCLVCKQGGAGVHAAGKRGVHVCCVRCSVVHCTWSSMTCVDSWSPPPVCNKIGGCSVLDRVLDGTILSHAHKVHPQIHPLSSPGGPGTARRRKEEHSRQAGCVPRLSPSLHGSNWLPQPGRWQQGVLQPTYLAGAPGHGARRSTAAKMGLCRHGAPCIAGGLRPHLGWWGRQSPLRRPAGTGRSACTHIQSHTRCEQHPAVCVGACLCRSLSGAPEERGKCGATRT